MDISVFEENETLKAILERVDRNLASKPYSNIVDDEGNQYVDLVMEGGGMLGIALVGYIYVLERAGIRFLSIGGTSAGSITALLLAAVGTPDKAKGKKLLSILANKNFYDFVDGGRRVRRLITTAIYKGLNFKVVMIGLFLICRLFKKWGLNPGKAFQAWIQQVINQEGIFKAKHLRERMHTTPPGLKIVNRSTEGIITSTRKTLSLEEDGISRLAIIAADVSTESKVEFPRMARLYWKDPDDVDPSKFVRASMSIPYFFRPFIIKYLPREHNVAELWKEDVGYEFLNENGLPEEAVFIDGGIMSNFPIDVFHIKDKTPNAPTLGVKLELDNRRQHIKNPLSLFGAIFNSARHNLDYDFLYKNPDYGNLVKHIPAIGYNWLDFNMSDENKLGLFLDGAKSAEAFLNTFNWMEYRDMRKVTKKLYQYNEATKIHRKRNLVK